MIEEKPLENKKIREIIVCIKYSPNSKSEEDTDWLQHISIYDQNVLAYALKLKRLLQCKLTVISMAPAKAKDFFAKLLYFNIDRVIMACDDSFAGADVLATSYLLAQIVKKINPKREYIIICGNSSMEGNTGMVGVELSQQLNVDLIEHVIGCELENEKLWIVRSDKKICITHSCLCVVRINCELELPLIKNIVLFDKSRFEEWDNDILKADLNKIGSKGSKTQVVSIFKIEEDNHTKRNFGKRISEEEIFEFVSKQIVIQ